MHATTTAASACTRWQQQMQQLGSRSILLHLLLPPLILFSPSFPFSLFASPVLVFDPSLQATKRATMPFFDPFLSVIKKLKCGPAFPFIKGLKYGPVVGPPNERP
eukprot:TRINITY_DN26601_c0_g1_i1.p1 TRINITY_DN26601_c0_g1~~TRINITY_DN26601_c0_g1_i1.p1  ORF type:complete len:105 (+),score=13.47 TRINITY_DN26601_c0_g1_i1:175-489(+)